MEVRQLEQDPGAAERTLRYARPGEVFRYHIGFLAKDRRGSGHALAWRILNLYERGLIDLVQRRLDANQWEYLAIRKRHRPQI